MTTRVAGGRSVGHTPCGCRSHPLSVKGWLMISDTTMEAAGDDGDTLNAAAHPQLSSPQPSPATSSPTTNTAYRRLRCSTRTHARTGAKAHRSCLAGDAPPAVDTN
eukprot:GHVU01181987.1.p1 GENE.GHVU01181987.1~~GHVU01181987.1.p1  ORF type:complete len:106 (-),score=4.63 GHVU01181987.1:178-495(-)